MKRDVYRDGRFAGTGILSSRIYEILKVGQFFAGIPEMFILLIPGKF